MATITVKDVPAELHGRLKREAEANWLIFYGVDQDNNLVLYRVRQGMMSLVVLRMES